MSIATFCFNPFSENTYLIWDSNKHCIIIDPGCSSQEEERELVSFISDKALKPVLLLNTHCHIDHIWGNYFITQKYQIPLQIHLDDLNLLRQGQMQAKHFGLSLPASPEPNIFIDPQKPIQVGEIILQVLHTPGHSQGSVCFWNQQEGYVLCGDVLFAGSIGRTDLPGGSYPVLMQSLNILTKTLPPETIVYSGHGQETTIGNEIKHNPFLN